MLDERYIGGARVAFASKTTTASCMCARLGVLEDVRWGGPETDGARRLAMSLGTVYSHVQNTTRTRCP